MSEQMDEDMAVRGLPDNVFPIVYDMGVHAGGSLAALDNSIRTTTLVSTHAIYSGLAVLHRFMDGVMQGFSQLTDDADETDSEAMLMLLASWGELHDSVASLEDALAEMDVDRVFINRDTDGLHLKAVSSEVANQVLLEVAKRDGSVHFADIGDREKDKDEERVRRQELREEYAEACAMRQGLQIPTDDREVAGGMDDGSVDNIKVIAGPDGSAIEMVESRLSLFPLELAKMLHDRSEEAIPRMLDYIFGNSSSDDDDHK